MSLKDELVNNFNEYTANRIRAEKEKDAKNREENKEATLTLYNQMKKLLIEEAQKGNSEVSDKFVYIENAHRRPYEEIAKMRLVLGYVKEMFASDEIRMDYFDVMDDDYNDNYLQKFRIHITWSEDHHVRSELLNVLINEFDLYLSNLDQFNREYNKELIPIIYNDLKCTLIEQSKKGLKKYETTKLIEFPDKISQKEREAKLLVFKFVAEIFQKDGVSMKYTRHNNYNYANFKITIDWQ